MIRETVLKTMSIGIVAKDIKEDEVYVPIYPIELYPDVDGEVTLDNVLSNKITDTSGGVSDIKVSKGAIIMAKWIPDGDTNRLEPPTVCKDEIVRLYRYGDTERYYWNTLFNQLDKRKLEKRTIVISDKQSINVPADELLKHSYYVTVDSINKLIHLHTADTDQEYTTYDIAIDTREGLLEITDGKDNKILLESKDDKWVISSKKHIETNTNVVTMNTRVHTQINTPTIAIQNSTNELLRVISDYIDVVEAAVGVGNLGADVPWTSGSKSAMQAIKARLHTFMTY